MSLRSRLSRGPALPTFKPPARLQILTACAAVLREWAGITPRQPDLGDLRRVEAEVRQYWDSHNALSSIAPKLLRHIPWFLFKSCLPNKPALGDDPDFSKAFAHQLKGRAYRSARTMAFVILRDYPEPEGRRQQWSAFTLQALHENRSAAVSRRWLELQSRFHLLDSTGPHTVAAGVVRSKSPEAYLREEVGLEGELRLGGFMRAVLLERLELLRVALAKDKATTDEVETVVALLVDHETKQLVFRDLRNFMAECLLEPFEDEDPTEDIRASIRALLLRYLKDPRIQPGEWAPVSATARAVMMRWLTARDLQLFFDLIDRTALDHMWRYRRAFWEAYLRHGHIDAAWVILDDAAGSEAVPRMRELMGASGRFERGGAGRSALLLKIQDVVVAEWSHNGKCRIWWAHDRDAPAMNKLRYMSQDLMSAAEYEITHSASANYSWQEKLATAIEDMTNIEMPFEEYELE